MTDRALVLLIVLGAAMVALAQDAGADPGQPDRTPSEAATTSAPVADADGPAPDGLEDQLEHAQEAISAGSWLVLAGIVLGVAIKVIRDGGAALGAMGGRWAWAAWLKSDRGTPVMAVVVAIGGYVSLTWTSGRQITVSGVMGSLAALGVAAGGRHLISRFVNPRDRPAPAGVT